MENSNKKERCVQLPIREENLLPGIPYEVALNKITPNLSWRDVHTLSSVNRAWNYAVRSRQVYDQSLRAGSTATFFPGYRSKDTIAFYSMGERSWYKLPPIPDVGVDKWGIRIPLGSGCVSMNGKIYVLGGQMNSTTGSRVFVFDVAAGGKWEECANMKEPREQFACRAEDGKIYVFGGRVVKNTGVKPVIGGEVYDPDKNACSPVKAMKFLLRGTETSLREYFAGFAPDMATYNASKDEWTRVQFPLEWGRRYLPFHAQGKIHSIHRIRSPQDQRFEWFMVDESYDVHEKSWTRRHSFSFDGLLPVGYVIRYPEVILYAEGELLAIVRWYRNDGGREEKRGQCLLQSRGFGSENEEISWELKILAFADVPNTTFANVLYENSYFILKLCSDR